MTYVPEDLAAREAAAATLAEIADLKEKRRSMREQCDVSNLPDEVRAKVEEIEAAQAVEMEEAARRSRLAIRDVFLAHGLITPEYVEVEEALERAAGAYNELEGPSLLTGEGGIPLRCKISGVPVWSTDEILEDFETNEVVLRAAIGLPPRPVDEDADGDEEIPE